jgi:cytochrome c
VSRHRASAARALPRALVMVLVLAAAPAAQASAQTALDMGCYNCHGTPPRKNAPTFAELARRYGEHRDDPAKQQQLADKLRAGTIFSHINAHERISPETAAALVRWLCEGAT